MTRAFPLFDGPHLAVLVLTVAVPGLLATWCHRGESGPRSGVAAGILTLIIAAAKISALTIAWKGGTLGWDNGLPLHLCDVAAGTAVIALLWRNQWAYEVTYFWGLAGTMHALITPDLPHAFPDPRYITFFASHSGLVAAVLFLTWGGHLRPDVKGLWRAFFSLLGYAVITMGINWAMGTNYGYTCAKPHSASLMDYLGPWPWYMGSMILLALASFWFYYIPFLLLDHCGVPATDKTSAKRRDDGQSAHATE